MKRLKKNLRVILAIITFNSLMWSLTFVLNFKVNAEFISKKGFLEFICSTMDDKNFTAFELFFKVLSTTSLTIGIIVIFGMIISLILKENDC